MGKCFLHGNGGADNLNFRVIAYPTEDALLSDRPKENTIGVVTSQKITGIYFFQQQPKNVEEGTVWILNGTFSQVAFNALKKGGIQVYPISAMQYVDGTWKNVTAKSFQNGAWVDWSIYLFHGGDVCKIVTDGYVEVSYRSTHTNTNGWTTVAEGAIQVSATSHPSGSGCRFGRSTGKKVDLTNVSVIKATGKCTSGRNTAAGVAGVGIRVVESQSLEASASADVMVSTAKSFEIEMDVSKLTGAYYIICYASERMYGGYSNGVTGSGYFTNIWMQ